MTRYRLVKLYSNRDKPVMYVNLDGQDLIDRASKATRDLVEDVELGLTVIVISKEPETSD